MSIKRTAPLALAAMLIAGTAVAKEHENHGDRDNHWDTAALAHTTVTLQQAIQTAEKQAGGRAVSAELARDNGTTHFAVEVVGQQGVKTVLVDGQSGLVTATRDAGRDKDDEEND